MVQKGREMCVEPKSVAGRGDYLHCLSYTRLRSTSLVDSHLQTTDIVLAIA
jgi:hypothetical protein